MNLPPLYALKIFETAGRCESFKEAARIHSVTPGAVSRQIGLLEEFMGAPLFHRLHREVRLTVHGKEYLEEISRLLAQIDVATTAFQNRTSLGPLHIWCPMTFSTRWLIPRLTNFQLDHPECRITFSTNLEPVNYHLNNADVAIRIGQGNWPHLISRKLIDIELVPVCSPAYLRVHPLTKVEELRDHKLLHSLVHKDYWKIWFDAHNVDAGDLTKGTYYGSVSLAYQVAREGHGVAIAQHALIAEDLEQGTLVMPFPNCVPIADAFYLIYPSATYEKRYVPEFLNWLIREAEQFETSRKRMSK